MDGIGSAQSMNGPQAGSGGRYFCLYWHYRKIGEVGKNPDDPFGSLFFVGTKCWNQKFGKNQGGKNRRDLAGFDPLEERSCRLIEVGMSFQKIDNGNCVQSINLLSGKFFGP